MEKIKKCPHCGSRNINEFKDFTKKNRCYDCKFEFSIRKNTIFDDSKITLKKWFMVIYLANSNKKGVGSLAVAKQVGVTQKTAWFMLQRIKNAIVGLMFKNQFDGTTEIDEAYIGGKYENMHTSKKQTAPEKTAVIGMVNRDTKAVKAMRIPAAEKEFLLPNLKNHFSHKMVKHSAKEYVRNDVNVQGRIAFKVHTNSIEGFCSQVKRTVNGTHHWISKKHINKLFCRNVF